jgi:hypothetical protein
MDCWLGSKGLEWEMMRSIYLLAIPAALLAQSTTTVYQTGVNGERVASRPNTINSANGRPIPTQQASEKVLRDDANGKVVERTVQRFSANGQPAGTEKVLIEETPLPGGGKISKETRSETDMNGHFSPTERRTTETRVNGLTTTTNITVDRPTPNNTFQTAEKRNTVTVGPKEKQTSTETIERADVAGRFRPVQRTETNVQIVGGKTTQNTAVYDSDIVGKFGLSKQTVATTTKGPSGEVTVTDVYSTATLGRTGTQADKLQLQQELVTEKKINPDGSTNEIVRLRTSNPSDPSKLSTAEKITETVCTGKCIPDAPPAVPAPAPAAAKPKPAVKP